MAPILTGERPTGSYDYIELSEDVVEERKAVIRRAIDLEPNNPVPFLVQPIEDAIELSKRLGQKGGARNNR